jgi:predicted dehydrogenase
MVDFADAIQEGRQAATPLVEGARSLDLALAARKSAETGEVVRL